MYDFNTLIKTNNAQARKAWSKMIINLYLAVQLCLYLVMVKKNHLEPKAINFSAAKTLTTNNRTAAYKL